MNRNVYALLTAAILASMVTAAQAETMAERKQRIMRKYMRERQDIMQSDLGVPDAPQEDSRVVESEQFKDIDPDFRRQTGGTAPLPAARPLPVQQPERNWWLETAEIEEDPFANPFSSNSNTDKESAGFWSPWGRGDDSSVYGGAYGQQRNAREDSYSNSREDSIIYGDDAYPDGQSAYGIQSQSGNRPSAGGMSREGYSSRRMQSTVESDLISGFYGRQQPDSRGGDSGWGYKSVEGYESLPSSGLPRSSFPASFDAQTSSSQNQTPAYTPYRSPYQDRGDEPRRYGDPLQSQYSRPNNYQKWKDTNKAWDPAANNSYLDELMRNQRR